jgi:hypothetical protein
MKISRELKNQIIGYVKEYAYRISNSKNQIKTMNSFDSKAAAEAVIRALKKNDAFVETETLNDPEFENYLIDFFNEKLPINYLAIKRNIGYYEAKSLLTEKGTDFFPELRGLKNSFYKRKNNDYPATENQIKYIVAHDVRLNHANEISGREASLIISCLINPKKTKPAYFNYYIRDTVFAE